jgi:hypothetical protein
VRSLRDVTRSEMPPAIVDALFQDLHRVDDLSARLDTIVLQPAPPQSPAGIGRTDKLQAMGYDLAATYLRAAIDHVHTWLTLLRAGEVPSYAHFSLLRTAHESALIALWLLEPGLSSDDRCARGVAAQLTAQVRRGHGHHGGFTARTDGGAATSPSARSRQAAGTHQA